MGPDREPYAFLVRLNASKHILQDECKRNFSKNNKNVIVQAQYRILADCYSSIHHAKQMCRYNILGLNIDINVD